VAVTIIRGKVVNPRGDPVAGAAVYVVSSPVSMPDIAMLSDERGEFALAFPAPGLYAVGARSGEWGAAQTKVEVAGEEEVTIEIRLTAAEGA
jgi:hypothetical protein